MSLRTTGTIVCVALLGAWLLRAEPAVALTLFAILAVGIVASLKLGGWVRNVTIGGGLIGLLLIFPNPIGERSNSEANAIATLQRISFARHAGAPELLEPELSGGRQWRGYRYVVHTGGTPNTRFAVIAVPANSKTANRRSFCTDDTKAIYITPSGAVPHVQDGRCVDTSHPIK
jgi:hypothetical protein